MEERRFGGRLQPKQEDKAVDWANLVELRNERMAFIYQRLSSHEQLRRSVYSIKGQDALEDLAKEHGYAQKQVYIERRDLGISGTKGQEEREGLAYLIRCIEQNLVESVYVVHISRLFRDQTLIDAFAFGELCKKHGVIIVTPQMRLNLSDRMHMRLYRMEVERAADELELMRSRLGGAVKIKAQQGYYAGGSIPPGYILNVDKQIEIDGKLVNNPDYHKLKVYEPHAAVIRKIFKLACIPGMTAPQILRILKKEGITLPPFPEEIAKVRANTVCFKKSEMDADGNWIFTVSRIRSILQNPTYIGWWIWGKELVKTDNHTAIVSAEDFFAAQNLFDDRPHRPKNEFPPCALSGLLYCGLHDVPNRFMYSNATKVDKYDYATYMCRDIANGIQHVVIRGDHLDQIIGQAVISQCSYPELANEVVARLEEEYKEVKTRAVAHGKELRRLKQEIDNLESNYYTMRLSAERAEKIETMIQERLARLKELSEFENTEINKLVGTSITPEEILTVKEFLTNLSSGWDLQPSDIQNAFFRLVLKQVTVWHSPSDILVCLTWRTGLEQYLVIHKLYREPYRMWSEKESAIVREHFPNMPHDDLMALLPERSWREIRSKAERLKVRREIQDAKPGGGRIYQSWEDEIIEKHYRGELSMGETVAKLPGRTEEAVRCRMHALGLTRDFSKLPEWEWTDPTFFTKGQDAERVK